MLSPCSRALLEKLTVAQILKKFPAAYETIFFTVFTTARHYLTGSLISILRYIIPVRTLPHYFENGLMLSFHNNNKNNNKFYLLECLSTAVASYGLAHTYLVNTNKYKNAIIIIIQFIYESVCQRQWPNTKDGDDDGTVRHCCSRGTKQLA
jgi:hypothetical protein